MTIIPSVVTWLNNKRLNQIELYRKYPEEIQQKVLKGLLAKASNTEWGRKYGYSSITTIRDYQNRIPVQAYEEIIPFVERLRNGESDILWPGEVKWFAKSSGTTSTKSKFIPVTRESLEECHYRGAKDILVVYTKNYPGTKIYSGKGLILGGSHRINRPENKSIYGDLSAILIEKAPFWVDFIRTPESKIALLEDFEEKLHQIVELTVKQNITNISGVPSWFLVLIKQILAYSGKSDLHEVWPNLEVFFHGGICFTPYREQFRNLIKGDRMNYMESYNASEGFFGLQDDPSVSDMLLMLDLGIFYEFIPFNEINSDNPPVLAIGEVSEGVSYAVVISTNGGLWRYLIGDTIVFTHLRPHRFIISGRTKHYINAFGEEVIIDNADKALEMACKATGAIVAEYTAGPVFIETNSRGSHEWLIEFEKEPRELDQFTNLLDEALKSLNSDYEAKRFKDLNLVRPVVRSVRPGTFYKWLREKNKLGGQNKVPRLSNTREYIEDLYLIAGIRSA